MPWRENKNRLKQGICSAKQTQYKHPLFKIGAILNRIMANYGLHLHKLTFLSEPCL